MVRLLLANVVSKPDTALESFNPTMVRLLPIRLFDLLLMAYPFQSHNGAIAASIK